MWDVERDSKVVELSGRMTWREVSGWARLHAEVWRSIHGVSEAEATHAEMVQLMNRRWWQR